MKNLGLVPYICWKWSAVTSKDFCTPSRIAIDGTVAELTATESLEDVFLRHTGAQA